MISCTHLSLSSSLLKTKVLIKFGAVSLALVLSSVNALEAKVKVEFEEKRRGVQAKLVDDGDFFLHPSGKPIHFLRKEGVYEIQRKAVIATTQAKRIELGRQLKAKLGDRVKVLAKYQFGNASLIKLEKISAHEVEAQLKAIDSSITSVKPVLANSKGHGDIVTTDRFLIKIVENNQRVLNAVLNKFGLMHIRKLNVSEGVHLVESIQRGLKTSELFNLTRQISRDLRVEWAQPIFNSKPFKTSFEPSDPLYTKQWHLRNTGQGGALCDADCDANNAWGLGNRNGSGPVTGEGAIIAVIDDGVQLNHPDLAIWSNEGESSVTNGCSDGIDNDGNGYVDDCNGWDFVDDDSSQAGSCGEDDIRGTDNDPSPQKTTNCVTPNGDLVYQDNHGTAVAGIAAAKEGNGLGGVGVAFGAKILPIRLISEFDANIKDFCSRAAEAMAYAGTYADVINNSWAMVEGTCPVLDVVIKDVVSGDLAPLGGVVAQRRQNKGSPVVFASGNAASGWIKITAEVEEGGHAYEWRFLRSSFPDDFDETEEANSAWLDDIKFPNGAIEPFENGLGRFTNECELNICDEDCLSAPPSCAKWSISSDPNHSRSGKSARVNTTNSDCSNSFLHTYRNGPAGEITFWVWVSTSLEQFSDRFEFLIDGKEVISFGDLPQVIDNSVAYPANLIDTIAVGASDAGDLTGLSAPSLVAEDRIYYSQYGPELDLVAPSSNQHLAIVTTDRTGVDGYNSGQGNINGDYTEGFGGTSASAPMVAGVAAAMIASDSGLTAVQIRQILRATADKIGPRGSVAYDKDQNRRSNFYGYGRVNMFNALKEVLSESGTNFPLCDAQRFNYVLERDLVISAFDPQPTEFCPAKGALEAQEELCFPIKTKRGSVAMVCL